MNCEGCNEEEAVFTLIPVGEGLPESIGVACFARRGLELAKRVLPAEEIAQQLGPMFVGPATPAAQVKGSKRRKQEEPPAETAETAAEGQTGGEVEEPPAAAN